MEADPADYPEEDEEFYVVAVVVVAEDLFVPEELVVSVVDWLCVELAEPDIVFVFLLSVGSDPASPS